ncbi:hypothetical protein KKF05_01130 [Patescibacteria group bacterium]|nr:hypothetical protein [Patescibacteria group bacterium]MBU1028735.1 hypothetical protein [Patescibacteria group bacterium]
MNKPSIVENKPAEAGERKILSDGAVEQSLETEKTPETTAEQVHELTSSETGETPTSISISPAIQAIKTTTAARDPLLSLVERELEDGLWDVYRELSPSLRVRFKAEGERIARVVRDGMATGRLTAKRLIEMIIDWLKMIPHVNKWFLRQEAKIKADALMQIDTERHNKSSE